MTKTIDVSFDHSKGRLIETLGLPANYCVTLKKRMTQAFLSLAEETIPADISLADIMKEEEAKFMTFPVSGLLARVLQLAQSDAEVIASALSFTSYEREISTRLMTLIATRFMIKSMEDSNALAIDIFRSFKKELLGDISDL